jgi:hypothetical protein
VATCPECECEFDDPLEICPHCNVPLVNREEAEAGAGDGEAVDENLPAEGLVVIDTTTDDTRVGQIRELLEESGIPCFLSYELFPTDPPPDETKVFIPREMVDDAKRLMRDYFTANKTAT